MYAHIEGTVSEKFPDALVIDCGGVGYLLATSASTLSAAPAIGERMKCYTYLSVREDALELFGFATREEKVMFEQLKSVGGVGPKTALQVLSTLSVRDLSIAIATGDAQLLIRAPGIGKKTAQRLLLELRDKIDDNALADMSHVPVKAVEGSMERDAMLALTALGYTANEAQRAIAGAAKSAGTTDELIRLALKGMVN